LSARGPVKPRNAGQRLEKDASFSRGKQAQSDRELRPNHTAILEAFGELSKVSAFVGEKQASATCKRGAPAVSAAQDYGPEIPLGLEAHSNIAINLQIMFNALLTPNKV
jgi:hypothetical protein